MKNQQNDLYLYFLWAIIFSLLCSIESWIFGSASWIYGYGSGLETIPVFRALTFEDRNLSLWSPFIAGGLDRLAFWGNTSPFGLEQFLFSNLPTWLANGLDRFLQYFVAVFFTSLIAKEQFALSRGWNILAGTLMGCFSYLTVGALFTISGVPLLIWIIYRLFTPNTKAVFALLSGILFSFCTTFSFGVPYLLLFMMGWFLIVRPIWTWHAFRQILLFSMGLIVFTSPQLFAIASNVKFSHRAHWPGEMVDFHSIDGFLYRQLQFDLFAQDPWLSQITLITPGLLMIIGIVISYWSFQKQDLKSYTKFYLRTVTLYAILSQKWLWIYLQLSVSRVFPWIMGVYMGRFYQIPAAFLIAINLTLVSFLAWNLFHSHRFARYVGSGLAVFFIAFMIIWPKWHLLYPLGVHDWGEKNYEINALESIKRIEKEPFRVVSVLPLQPAYAYAQGLETADGWANIFPAIYRDVWLKILDPLFQKMPLVKQILDPEHGKPQDNYIFLGLDLIQPQLGALPNENIALNVKNGFDLDPRFNLNLLRALNVKYLLSEYPLNSSEIKLTHKPTTSNSGQPRCYATGLITERRHLPCKENMPQTSFSQLFSDFKSASNRKKMGKDIFIYELTDTMPRFRFIQNLLVESTDKSVLEKLATLDAKTHLHTAIINEKDVKNLNTSKVYRHGQFELTKYHSDSLELKVNISGDSLLIIANTWNPYWHAKVDGKERDLIRVNHAQFALPLFSGDHTIRMYYAPPYSPSIFLHQLYLKYFEIRVAKTL